MNSLPKLTVQVRNFDPNWKPIYAPDAPTIAINANEHYKTFEVEAEVVQLNLSTGTMRVRYDWPSPTTKSGWAVATADIPITEFFKNYAINKL